MTTTFTAASVNSTFTPGIADNSLDGSGEGQSYSIQIGRYSKVGNRVFFHLHVRITDLGTLTSNQIARVVGLPFIAKSLTNSHPAVSVGYGDSLALPNASESVTGYVEEGTTHIILNTWDSVTGVTNLLISELSAGGQLIISGQYEL